MSKEYNVQLDTEFKIDPAVRQQVGEQTFWSFIETAYPDHVKVLLGTLNRTPEVLEIELSVGYAPSISTCHTLTTVTGDIEVALLSEMMELEGKRSLWRTTITTAGALNNWRKANHELPS